MSKVEASGLRLTAMQVGMVLASIRDPGSGVYIVQDVCESPEPLDLARLQRAWRVLSGRHPALRTTVEIRADSPVQWAGETAAIEWNESDWTGMAAADRYAKLDSFLNEDRARGFDFARGVPLRVALIYMPGNASILIWTSHHALLDGRSYLIVWREWLAIYDAVDRGTDVQLPDAQPFGQYLDWLDAQDFTAAERYWRQQLAGVSRTTSFIVDRLRTAGASDNGSVAREQAIFSEETTGDVRNFARRYDLTAGTLVQCAWALLLSRYGGVPEVVFGVTRTGRRMGPPGVEDTVGPLINTLPFRVAVSPGMQVLPWLRQVREQIVALRQYEHTPLTKIREWNILPSGAPPFDTLFVYEYELPGETLRKLGGSWSERRITRRQRTDAPLTLAATGSPRLTLEVIYDTRLFCRETIAGIAGHLQALIESFIAQPDSRLGELNMLTARERQRLIDERNPATASGEQDLCAHRLFERQAHRTPAAVAIEHAGAPISFEQLNRRSNQLAGFLRERGAAPEDVVGVCMRRSPDAVAAVLAVLKAGAAFVLLPPDLPAPRLAAMLQDARPKLVLAGGEYAARLHGCGCEALSLERSEPEIARQSPLNPACISKPDHAAYAAFTSGSTGRPKAAIITHRSLVNHTLAVARVYGISSADRRLQFAAIGSDMFISEIFTYLCWGAALVFCLDTAGNSIAEFLRLIEAHRITITGMPSSWWSAWAAGMAGGNSAIPQGLRAVIVGMERLNPATWAAFRRAAGGRLRLFNAYGPAETGPTTTIYEAGSSPWESASLVPVGRPISDTRVYVLDGYGNLVPAGVPGELYIAGKGVARGYLNAPDPTAAKFLPDPYGAEPAGRMFRTGDLGFLLPDGNLAFLGRADRQVKIRGFRVEPEEIEAALAEHAGIRQCAVVARLEDGSQTLAAYITAASVPAPAAGELRLHLLRRLPDYMVPAHFTILPEMPLTSNGKIDRQSLAANAPRPQPREDVIQPATDIEKRLARFWQEVLGPTPVSATANFFESGGDSLRATQLVVRIQREFGRDFPFASFLRAPTIAQIAQVLNGEAPAGELFAPHQGTRLPLFCITSDLHDRYVFRHLTAHLDPTQPVFVLNVPFTEGEGACPVEELAARVCRSIRGIRAEGPYILGGYCFGGMVAFEAARQSIAGGAQVPLVALFDTPAPGYPRFLGSRRMAAWVQAIGRRPDMVTASAPVIAARNYVPKRVNADIAQFMAQEQVVSSRVLQDPRLAWRDLCGGHFRVYRVPGDHITWLQEPNAKAAAARLTEALGLHSRITVPLSR